MDAIIYVLSVNGLMFFMSIIFYFFPPKKVNRFYGYRTHRTMANEEVWYFANATFNKSLLIYSAIGFATALILAYINEELMTSWFPMAFLFFTLLICIVSTEKALNENFDKEGNRLKK